jgi:ubiquinone/menaquinone biosynthesis C-methylase UbiE
VTKLYSDLADWWPLMSAPADYAEEAAFYFEAMQQASTQPIETMLELGAGGGNNASHMKHRVKRLVLTDVSDGMLAHSRKLNPGCEHLVGDMRTVRLNHQFDAVFVHDAISYLTSEADVARAIETAFVHCRPGGVALFAPDHVRENFKAGTDCGGHDAVSPDLSAVALAKVEASATAGDARAMRYLEWSWDPDPNDSTCTTDYTYVLRESDGSITVVHDRHIEGMFPRDTWLRLFRQAGFEPRVVPFDHSELEPGTYEIFVCVKPR